MAFGESVESIVAFAHFSEVTADGVGNVGSGHSSVFVNFGDVELNAGVVFGADQFAAGAAFSGVESLVQEVRHFFVKVFKF